jgi:hypothetical protein
MGLLDYLIAPEWGRAGRGSRSLSSRGVRSHRQHVGMLTASAPVSGMTVRHDIPKATVVLSADTQVWLHQYGVCCRVDLGLPFCRHRDRSSASRRSWSARPGTTKDARNIGRKLFPVHRKATVWLSAAPKVSVRLEFRPLRIAECDVQVRLVSRSCRSFRAIRHADRRPQCRTCHVGPRLDCLMRHLQGCCHLGSPLSVGRATAPSCSPVRVPAHRLQRVRSIAWK